MNRDHRERFFKTTRPRAELRAGRNDWFRILPVTAQAGTRTATVLIYDEIGYFGVTAQDFVNELDGLDVDQITLRINSPGGSVFDGLVIYNRLVEHPAAVHVSVDGMAASAASFIAMAGDTRSIKPEAMMMIHDASGMVIGNAADMLDMADLLDTASENMSKLYARRTGHGTPEVWRAMMTPTDTRFTAEEALAVGLVHTIDNETSDDETATAQSSFDLSLVYPGEGREPDLAALVNSINPDNTNNSSGGSSGGGGGGKVEEPGRRFDRSAFADALTT